VPEAAVSAAVVEDLDIVEFERPRRSAGSLAALVHRAFADVRWLRFMALVLSLVAILWIVSAVESLAS
jgi:hypothetical protein